MATLFGGIETDRKKKQGTSLFGGGSTLFGSGRYDTESVQRSIDNAALRIQDAGYKVDSSDGRNGLERALNLPSGQNAFFDVLEVLQRPFQGVANVVDKSLFNGTQGVGEAFTRGISGRDKVRGTDIAEDFQITNPVAKAVAGTLLEVGLDPLTYVPGGVLLKGAKAATKPLFGAAKFGAEQAMKIPLVQKAVDKAEPFVSAGKDKLGYMFNPEHRARETLTGGESDFLTDTYRQTENNRRFLQEEYSNNLLKTAQKTGLEAGENVGRFMERDLRGFEDVKGYEFPDGMQRTTERSTLFGAMQTNREAIKSTGKEIRDVGRDFDKQISQTADELGKVEGQIRRLYFSRENAALRQLNNRKNKPLNIDELAQNKAFEQVGASPKFNLLLRRREELKSNLDTLRTEAKQAKAANVSKIQSIVDENAALKEAAKNPVIMQKQIERPVRDMPTDPAVQQAARTLMSTNAEIRGIAEAEGIPINELEGYMTHVLSAEERAARKKNKVLKVDQGQFNTGNPNKKVVGERTIQGLSAEDVNEKLGKKLFEPNAYFATAIGQRRLIDYISAVSFRKKVLNNPDFAVKLDDFKKKHGDELPANSVIIDVNNYKFIKPEGDLMEDVASKDIGGQYVVTKAVKEKLERYKYAMTDEGSKAFLNALDTAQSWWKRLALFSVPYHIRNDVGAKFNLWVGGMSAKDIAQYSPQGYREAFDAMVKGQESDLYKAYRKQGLSSTSQSQVEFARYGQEPEQAIEKMVREGSKDMKGKVKDRLNPLRAFETSREIGDFIDQSNRFAMFKWAVEKKGMSYEKAAEMVRESLFDYTRLTNFERQYMTRIMPFYRWMRNNLPYQIRQFVNDPRKYANLNKARLNAQEAVGINEENVPDYMKEGFSLPVFMNGEGKGKMLGFNLPLGDLTKLSDPLKLGVDALSPAIKLPIELSSNFNIFRGKPIEQFQGQEKKFTLFGKDLGGIPIKTAYALEQTTGQIGRGLSSYLQKPESEDQDNKFRMPSFGISSILKDFDVDAANYFELRDHLRQLQDYINFIEQQEGVRPRSVNEIRR